MRPSVAFTLTVLLWSLGSSAQSSCTNDTANVPSITANITVTANNTLFVNDTISDIEFSLFVSSYMISPGCALVLGATDPLCDPLNVTADVSPFYDIEANLFGIDGNSFNQSTFENLIEVDLLGAAPASSATIFFVFNASVTSPYEALILFSANISALTPVIYSDLTQANTVIPIGSGSGILVSSDSPFANITIDGPLPETLLLTPVGANAFEFSVELTFCLVPTPSPVTPPVVTPTPTEVPTPTQAPTPTPSDVPTPTPVSAPSTPTPADTPTPTPTPTPEDPTPTPTPTPIPAPISAYSFSYSISTYTSSDCTGNLTSSRGAIVKCSGPELSFYYQFVCTDSGVYKALYTDARCTVGAGIPNTFFAALGCDNSGNSITCQNPTEITGGVLAETYDCNNGGPSHLGYYSRSCASTSASSSIKYDCVGGKPVQKSFSDASCGISSGNSVVENCPAYPGKCFESGLIGTGDPISAKVVDHFSLDYDDPVNGETKSTIFSLQLDQDFFIDESKKCSGSSLPSPTFKRCCSDSIYEDCFQSDEGKLCFDGTSKLTVEILQPAEQDRTQTYTTSDYILGSYGLSPGMPTKTVQAQLEHFYCDAVHISITPVFGSVETLVALKDFTKFSLVSKAGDNFVVCCSDLEKLAQNFPSSEGNINPKILEFTAVSNLFYSKFGSSDSQYEGLDYLDSSFLSWQQHTNITTKFQMELFPDSSKLPIGKFYNLLKMDVTYDDNSVDSNPTVYPPTEDPVYDLFSRPSLVDTVPVFVPVTRLNWERKSNENVVPLSIVFHNLVSKDGRIPEATTSVNVSDPVCDFVAIDNKVRQLNGRVNFLRTFSSRYGPYTEFELQKRARMALAPATSRIWAHCVDYLISHFYEVSSLKRDMLQTTSSCYNGGLGEVVAYSKMRNFCSKKSASMGCTRSSLLALQPLLSCASSPSCPLKSTNYFKMVGSIKHSPADICAALLMGTPQPSCDLASSFASFLPSIDCISSLGTKFGEKMSQKNSFMYAWSCSSDSDCPGVPCLIWENGNSYCDIHLSYDSFWRSSQGLGVFQQCIQKLYTFDPFYQAYVDSQIEAKGGWESPSYSSCPKEFNRALTFTTCSQGQTCNWDYSCNSNLDNECSCGSSSESFCLDKFGDTSFGDDVSQNGECFVGSFATQVSLSQNNCLDDNFCPFVYQFYQFGELEKITCPATCVISGITTSDDCQLIGGKLYKSRCHVPSKTSTECANYSDSSFWPGSAYFPPARNNASSCTPYCQGNPSVTTEADCLSEFSCSNPYCVPNKTSSCDQFSCVLHGFCSGLVPGCYLPRKNDGSCESSQIWHPAGCLSNDPNTAFGISELTCYANNGTFVSPTLASLTSAQCNSYSLCVTDSFVPLSEYSTSGIPNGVVSAGAATCDSGSKKVSGYKWIAGEWLQNSQISRAWHTLVWTPRASVSASGSASINTILAPTYFNDMVHGFNTERAIQSFTGQLQCRSGIVGNLLDDVICPCGTGSDSSTCDARSDAGISYDLICDGVNATYNHLPYLELKVLSTNLDFDHTSCYNIKTTLFVLKNEIPAESPSLKIPLPEPVKNSDNFLLVKNKFGAIIGATIGRSIQLSTTTDSINGVEACVYLPQDRTVTPFFPERMKTQLKYFDIAENVNNNLEVKNSKVLYQNSNGTTGINICLKIKKNTTLYPVLLVSDYDSLAYLDTFDFSTKVSLLFSTAMYGALILVVFISMFVICCLSSSSKCLPVTTLLTLDVYLADRMLLLLLLIFNVFPTTVDSVRLIFFEFDITLMATVIILMFASWSKVSLYSTTAGGIATGILQGILLFLLYGIWIALIVIYSVFTTPNSGTMCIDNETMFGMRSQYSVREILLLAFYVTLLTVALFEFICLFIFGCGVSSLLGQQPQGSYKQEQKKNKALVTNVFLMTGSVLTFLLQILYLIFRLVGYSWSPVFPAMPFFIFVMIVDFFFVIFMISVIFKNRTMEDITSEIEVKQGKEPEEPKSGTGGAETRGMDVSALFAAARSNSNLHNSTGGKNTNNQTSDKNVELQSTARGQPEVDEESSSSSKDGNANADD